MTLKKENKLSLDQVFKNMEKNGQKQLEDYRQKELKMGKGKDQNDYGDEYGDEYGDYGDESTLNPSMSNG